MQCNRSIQFMRQLPTDLCYMNLFHTICSKPCCTHMNHWRIEGGPKGPCPPPPLKLVKVYVVNSRSQTNKVLQTRVHRPIRCTKLKLFFKFPTISIIYLININKYYKI